MRVIVVLHNHMGARVEGVVVVGFLLVRMGRGKMVVAAVVHKTLDTVLLAAVHMDLKKPKTALLAVVHKALAVLLPRFQQTSTAGDHNHYMLNEDLHSHSAVVVVMVEVAFVVALLEVVQIHTETTMETAGIHNHSRNLGSLGRMPWDQERSQGEGSNYNRNYNYMVVR